MTGGVSGVGTATRGQAEFLELAACAGKPLEWFFPPAHARAHTAYARGKQVCASCPVIDRCDEEHRRAERETGMALPGLWAGKTEADRRGRRPRLEERRATIRECVVCGGPVRDSGYGAAPRYCDSRGPCAQRAGYRRRIGAPESDEAFAVWSDQGRPRCEVGA